MPSIPPQSTETVRVEIFDIVYNLRGTDPTYIKELAEYVDTKMRAVASQTSTVDTIRLAVLAALNIADEHHMLLQKTSGNTSDYTSDYTKRAKTLNRVLDEVLDKAG